MIFIHPALYNNFLRYIIMSLKTSYNTIRINVNGIPNTQLNGDWSGNPNPVGYLNKGVYFCNLNIGLQSNGGATIQTMTVAVSSVLPWVDGNSNIIMSSPNTGNRVVSATQPLYYPMCNVCIIDTDNTPIYLMITSSVNVGTWGTTISGSQQANIISFTKIGNV